MRDIRFSVPAQLSSWTWLYLDSDRPRPFFRNQPLAQMVDRLKAKLEEMGLRINRPNPGTTINLSGRNDEEEIDKAIGNLIDRYKPALILTITHMDDSSLYCSIKKVCDLRRGVLNVNVLAKKFEGANDQYLANVGLKFNLKLGGTNQTLELRDVGILSNGKTMLVGVDVTHPSPGSDTKAPSVAAVVASVDSNLGQWPAEFRVQEGRKEMVDTLDQMLKSRLRVWAKRNKNQLPENIIVYRDGVSEGQYKLVEKDEIPLLKRACADVYAATETKKGLPRLTVAIVSKRHHTRFYPTSNEDADRSMNTKNGTVVDRGVTEARNWDFYLQAHTALKGTARPAHYYIVWDEIFRRQAPSLSSQNAADIFENLTHKMCYMFGRATKSVSLCPPAYYADLACERARRYLAHVFDPTPQMTPLGSMVSGSGSGATSSDNIDLHPNVRDAMVYI